MAAGAWTFYHAGKLAIGRGLDLSSSTFKMSLHSSTYTPSVSSHAAYADLTNELSTANGYTSGGATMSNVTWTNSSGTEKWTADPTAWTASGGAITARYAVIRASGTFNTIVDPIICYCLLDSTPADVTASSGNALTVTMNASGAFTLA